MDHVNFDCSLVDWFAQLECDCGGNSFKVWSAQNSRSLTQTTNDETCHHLLLSIYAWGSRMPFQNTIAVNPYLSIALPFFPATKHHIEAWAKERLANCYVTCVAMQWQIAQAESKLMVPLSHQFIHCCSPTNANWMSSVDRGQTASKWPCMARGCCCVASGGWSSFHLLLLVNNL